MYTCAAKMYTAESVLKVLGVCNPFLSLLLLCSFIEVFIYFVRDKKIGNRCDWLRAMTSLNELVKKTIKASQDNDVYRDVTFPGQ